MQGTKEKNTQPFIDPDACKPFAEISFGCVYIRNRLFPLLQGGGGFILLLCFASDTRHNRMIARDGMQNVQWSNAPIKGALVKVLWAMTSGLERDLFGVNTLVLVVCYSRQVGSSKRLHGCDGSWINGASSTTLLHAMHKVEALRNVMDECTSMMPHR